MNWYYSTGDTSQGPLDDAAFGQLVARGVITPDTLVWRDDQGEWRPYRELAVTALSEPPARTAPPAAVAAAPEAATRACAECGRHFPLDDLLAVGQLHICAACKPLYLQRLREGGGYRTSLNFATVGRRFGALIIDNLLMQMISMGIQFLFTFMWAMRGGNERVFGALTMIFAMLVPILISMLYETLMVGRFGATVGKMALSLRVVRPDGGPLNYSRALGRYWAKFLSQAICYIGFIMAIFDKAERRALHDRLCDTRVIRL